MVVLVILIFIIFFLSLVLLGCGGTKARESEKNTLHEGTEAVSKESATNTMHEKPQTSAVPERKKSSKSRKAQKKQVIPEAPQQPSGGLVDPDVNKAKVQRREEQMKELENITTSPTDDGSQGSLNLGYSDVTFITYPDVVNLNANLRLLSLECRPGLVKIINNLDPNAFVVFSRTCKALKMISLISKGIKIPLQCRIVVDEYVGTRIVFYVRRNQDYSWCSVVGPMLRKIQKSQQFHCKTEINVQANEVNIELLTNFLANFKYMVIEQISFTPQYNSYPRIANWDDLFHFIKIYKISDVFLPEADVPVPAQHIEALLKLEVNNLAAMFQLPQGILMDIRCPMIKIAGSNLNSMEFRMLVQSVSWSSLPHILGWTFDQVHLELRSSESFHTCFDGITSLPADYHGVLPEERPLCFIMEDEVYVLTTTDKVYLFWRNIPDEDSLDVHLAQEEFENTPDALVNYL